MITAEIIQKLVNPSLLDSLEKDKGITEFFRFGDYCMGISFETDDESDINSERYIFNVFAGPEYLNVGYYPQNKGLNMTVYMELAEVWNKVVNIKRIVAERIQLNASTNEIEEILGEQISADLVEDLETHLVNAFYELDEDAFGKLMMNYLTPIEIGNLCKIAL